jgi:hypothetical protein
MFRSNRLLKILLIFQGTYTLITALWALIDIHSFMAVTGPKTDLWLVKTVAVLLIPISVSLILPAFFTSTIWQPLLVGLLSAIGLAIIDFYYSVNNTIDEIYMLDGILQCVFVIAWIYVITRVYR